MNELISQQGVNGVREARTGPKVGIIVLNWNGWRHTVECLESLQRLTYPSYQIIVVDNQSTDGSVEKIKAWARGEIVPESRYFQYNLETKPVQWTEYDRTTAQMGGMVERERMFDQLPSNRQLVLIQSGENLGVAGGNNVGIRYALKRWFDYIWLLNHDTVVDPPCLDLCVKLLEHDQRIGVVGPKILFYDNPSRIWYSGAKSRLWRGDIADVGRGELDSEKLSGLRSTDFVSGCAVLARRETFEEVGLLDEDYFILHSDFDWSCRVKNNSRFTLAVNLGAHIWHKEGGISTLGKVSVVSAYFANKHRFLVVSRHGSWLEKVAFTGFYALSRPVKFLLLLLRGRPDLVRAELRAVADLLAGQKAGFLTGCAMLIKGEVFEEVGLFDEEFFFYNEDVDFCLRVKKAGFKLLYVPQARSWHKIKRITKDRTSPFVMYHLARSQLLVLRKNFSAPCFAYGLLVPLLFHTPYRMLQIMQGSRSLKAAQAWIKGTGDGIIGG